MLPENKINHNQIEFSNIPILREKSKNSILDAKENICEVIVENMKALVKDNYDRMSSYSDKNVKPLSEGIFYPNEYCIALTNASQNARLEFLKKQGAFFHGHLSPKHFSMKSTQEIGYVTGKIPTQFWLEDGVKPSEALKSVHKGISLIGCGEACDIAFYETILDYLGEDKFNALLANDQAVPFCISHQKILEPISILFSKNANLKQISEIKKGQVFGVRNVEGYSNKHRYGEDQGINLICIDNKDGDKKFIGLGTSPDGISYDEVVILLFKAYNKIPIKYDQILSKEFAEKELENRIDGIMQDLSKYQNDNRMMLNLMYTVKSGLNRDLTVNETSSLFTKPREFAKLYFQAISNIQEKNVLSFEEFKKQGGGVILEAFELDESRLRQLSELSISEGREMIKVWANQANL